MAETDTNTVNETAPADSRYVLNVHRMTTHNGPGIRTLIQFKGCPLRCVWCSTPESQKMQPEIALFPSKCIQCNNCVPVCPTGAIQAEQGIVEIDRSLCNVCGACAEVCYTGAIKRLGQAMTVEQVLAEVKKDEVFYKHSGGGVTLSGGEPLLQPDYTGRLLRTLKANGISVGVDTCGYWDWTNTAPLLGDIDFFLWDIKHMDPQKHFELTGVSNELILKNAKAASERNIPIYIRLPVITGYNDADDNIRATCEFAQSLPSLVTVDIMPLHHLGQARYESLNRVYPLSSHLHVTEQKLQAIKQIVESYGIKCKIVT